MVRSEEFVERAPRLLQRLRSIRSVDPRDRLALNVLQAHVFGAADGQNPALPRHANRTHLPHLEHVFRNRCLGVQLQTNLLRRRGMQPHLHPLAIVYFLGLPFA